MIAGRLVLPALRWREDSRFEHECPVIEAALEQGVGGFILFGGTREAVRELTTSLVRDAGRPLLIGADLERGAGQQVSGLHELPPPLALASLNDESLLRGAGVLTALEALSVGINWIFAPVADLDVEPANPIVQTRSFGADPAAVARAVAAWVVGCEAGGALACAKHFLGHGRTTVDSHATRPVVDASAQLLRATDLVPFQAAVEAGVSSVMTAHVAYPALDPSGAVATFSKPILDLLRQELAFGGLIVTDALIMEGALGAGPDQLAEAVLGAGVDVLLYPPDFGSVIGALDRAGGRGAEFRKQMDAALERYHAAVSRLGPAPDTTDFERVGSPMATAHWLLSQPPARGSVPRLQAPLELVVVDDDQGGPYPASPNSFVAHALEARGVPLGTGGSRVVLAFAEPRAWKGRAGFGPESLRRLAETAPGADVVLLFAHPRLVETVPGTAPVMVAWHRQRLMQEAAAYWLAERLG